MATFVGPGGVSPSIHLNQLATASQVTIGDALYGGQAMRTRIRQRTASGVAYDGSPFPAYSDAYRKRKIAQLGHADTVDLFGANRHPHMLNALLVESGGTSLTVDQTSTLEVPGAASMVSLVIRGDAEAARARIHNEGGMIRSRLGTGKKKQGRLPKKASFVMPRRRFFDASADDLEFMTFAIGRRRDERLNAANR